MYIFGKDVRLRPRFGGAEADIVPLKARSRSAKSSNGTKFKSHKAPFSLSADALQGPSQEQSDVRMAVEAGTYQIASRYKNMDIYIDYLFTEEDILSSCLQCSFLCAHSLSIVTNPEWIG